LIKAKLNSIYNSIFDCGRKLTSATKFIDFFVHDILDYTILNKDDKTFSKNISVFNIKLAVDEIMETLYDKVSMKQINVGVELKGFEGCNKNEMYLVKSD
jgi:hypothetical protein